MLRVLLFIFLSGTALAAPRTSLESLKIIYLLDVTQYMVGYEGRTPDIFDDVRSKLINSISRLGSDNIEISLVIFTHKIQATIDAKSNRKGKEKLIDFLEKLSPYDYKPLTTNLKEPLKKGQELINPAKTNVLFLLTDGKHTHKNPDRYDFYNEIDNWSRSARGKNQFAYLVELTNKAVDDKLRSKISASSNFDVISGIEFTLFKPKRSYFIVNLLEPNKLSFKYELEAINGGADISNIKLPVKFESKDPRFNIEIVSQKGTVFDLKLVPKNNIDELKKSLDEELDLSVKVNYNDSSYPNIKLLDKPLKILIKNKKERILYINPIPITSN